MLSVLHHPVKGSAEEMGIETYDHSLIFMQITSSFPMARQIGAYAVSKYVHIHTV